MEIGFVGLGTMGFHMARRLIEAGHQLVVCDARPEAVARVTALGAVAASSPREVADRVETVMASLPSLDAVWTVATATNGAIEGAKVRRFVDLSTSGARTAQRIADALAARNIAAIDSPVSGGPGGAEKGTLAVMVSGPAADTDLLKPVLAVFGKVFTIGDRPGMAQTMKLVNNLLSATAMAVTSEAMVMGVKDAARSTMCAAMQERIYQATMAYSLNDNEWLPGVNRTGLKYRKSITAALAMVGDSTPDTPTTTYDWISPVLGSEMNLSPNRAMRTKQIFEDLGCPSTHRHNDQTWGYAPDLHEDFLPLMEEEGIAQVSYLAPATFHLAGPKFHPTQYERYGWTGPAIPPARYLPRMEKVGRQPSSKVFLADGTRYLTAGNVLDFDVSLNPKYYGSFTSSTPIYAGSTAYGTGQHASGWDYTDIGSAHEERRALSYRHGGDINVIYFDGHCGRMTETESKTNAAPWFPGGSEFTGKKATAESEAFHEIGEILH